MPHQKERDVIEIVMLCVLALFNIAVVAGVAGFLYATYFA